MNSKFYFSCIAATLVLNALSIDPAMSRGGGGGGGARGGFAGGYRGGFGDFDRTGFDRGFDNGFDNRAGDYYRGGAGRGGDLDSRMDGIGDGNRPDAFTGPRPAEQDLLSGADREYNYPKALPTDAGFGSVSSIAGASRTYRYSEASLLSHGNMVRSAFHNDDLYNRGWWDAHPNAWRYPYYYDRDWGYGYVGWGGLAPFWGMSADTALPDYDYGSNITYQNDEVYYGSTPACTADQYYNQAQELAMQAPPLVAPSNTAVVASGAKPKDADDWKPLGVYALTQGGQTTPTSLFQLAINKDGVVRGNYTNQLTGEVDPVQGKLDKKIMRVAWTVGNNKTTVYDTGLKNLLQKQSTVLVHMSQQNTQEWTLVRLDKPKSSSKTSVS